MAVYSGRYSPYSYNRPRSGGSAFIEGLAGGISRTLEYRQQLVEQKRQEALQKEAQKLAFTQAQYFASLQDPRLLGSQQAADQLTSEISSQLGIDVPPIPYRQFVNRQYDEKMIEQDRLGREQLQEAQNAQSINALRGGQLGLINRELSQPVVPPNLATKQDAFSAEAMWKYSEGLYEQALTADDGKFFGVQYKDSEKAQILKEADEWRDRAMKSFKFQQMKSHGAVSPKREKVPRPKKSEQPQQQDLSPIPQADYFLNNKAFQ